MTTLISITIRCLTVPFVYTTSSMHTNYVMETPHFIVFQFVCIEHTSSFVLLGYYHSMRALMDSKVPASIERPESLMSSQTSIAGTLLQLIHRPIALLGNAEYDTASK